MSDNPNATPQEEVVRHFLITVTSAGAINMDNDIAQYDWEPVEANVSLTFSAASAEDAEGESTASLRVTVSELLPPDTADWLMGAFEEDEVEVISDRRYDPTNESHRNDGFDLVVSAEADDTGDDDDEAVDDDDVFDDEDDSDTNP